jgi:phosphoserine phosphatase
MTTLRFRTVVFDCDSTLSSIEGIDELAGAQRAAISALTDAAMKGDVPLESVYEARLDLIRPNRHAVEQLGQRYIAAAVPDSQTTVRALRENGVVVKILSGGLREAILPFAHWLGLKDADVAAVDLRFHSDDTYAGFDEESPLARAGGKRTIMEEWRTRLPGPILMVGDGITDLEARPAVDRFIAYAGVVNRPAVTAAADAVILTRSLSAVLDEVLDTTAD